MVNQPGNVLRSLCSGAQYLVIAAPYIKVDALNRILADVSSAASLTCVTRWNPHDLVVGASDIKCRSIVTERGGSFMLHPSLHAKYYRIDDVVLVGSANLTLSAMGWTGQSNLEILCRPGDDFDWCTFQQNLLEGARMIGDDEFARWESITRIRAQGRHATSTIEQPILGAWRPLTRDPRHLELAYQERIHDIASSDEQQAAQRDIDALVLPPGLSNEQLRTWASTCLLAAPFTNSVIQLHGMNSPERSRLLAEAYGLGITEARRAMETVENWLAFLAPETLPENP